MFAALILCATKAAMACSDVNEAPHQVVVPTLQTPAIYSDFQWPGELGGVPLSKGAPIAYRARPERSAPVVGFIESTEGSPLCPGSGASVLYRSFSPTLWVLTQDVAIDLTQLEVAHRLPGHFLNRRTVRLRKGSTLRVVKYEGEGGLIALIDGRFYEFSEPSTTDQHGDAVAHWTVKRRGHNEIWFEVSALGSKTQRWVRYDPRVLTLDVRG